MRPRLAPLLALLGAGAGALAPAAAGAAGFSAPLAACARGQSGRCGEVRVPLDRSGAVPGAVDLRVRVLAARTATTKATVVGLAGGPGQAATPLLKQFRDVFGGAARSRRFVAFDQRGTGASGRLSCRALSSSRLSLAAVVGDCARELGPARASYTSAASVADLEAVRAALGVERIVLYGTSYGTKVALDYAAAYPQHVESLILDSVVPAAGVDPFQRTTLASMPRVLASVCADGGCRFARNPGGDLALLVRSLVDGPQRASYLTGSGRRRSARSPARRCSACCSRATSRRTCGRPRRPPSRPRCAVTAPRSRGCSSPAPAAATTATRRRPTATRSTSRRRARTAASHGRWARRWSAAGRPSTRPPQRSPSRRSRRSTARRSARSASPTSAARGRSRR